MNWTFMHKEIPVAELEIDEATGSLQKIGTVYAPEHLPIGIMIRNGMVDRSALNEWWKDRSIPASRSGIREALETLNLADPQALLVRCNGLSLSDQYWIRPENASFSWKDINFFDHDFSDDIGDILFGAKKKQNALDFSSPDNTSDGNLKKRWKIINGKRCLVKGGSNPFRQQPFNEVIASGIMELLAIPHVSYFVTWNKGAPYSICEDFVTRDTELVSAHRIMKSRKKSSSDSLYTHFVQSCTALGIKDAVPFLDRMITMDYIIANEDRHFNNFGALRNADTLEWLGMAPIYDSGSSLGYDKLVSQMRSERDVICKPFKDRHAEQLRLVSSFDWIDFGKLGKARELILQVFSAEEVRDTIDEARMDAIAAGVERRIENIQALAAAGH